MGMEDTIIAGGRKRMGKGQKELRHNVLQGLFELTNSFMRQGPTKGVIV